jgi:hypothetical protein
MGSGYACKSLTSSLCFVAHLLQLANNDSDPGMRISSLIFALGKARLRFDRQEGLC